MPGTELAQASWSSEELTDYDPDAEWDAAEWDLADDADGDGLSGRVPRWHGPRTATRRAGALLVPGATSVREHS